MARPRSARTGRRDAEARDPAHPERDSNWNS
jgi:hypothetical protein